MFSQHFVSHPIFVVAQSASTCAVPRAHIGVKSYREVTVLDMSNMNHKTCMTQCHTTSESTKLKSSNK